MYAWCPQKPGDSVGVTRLMLSLALQAPYLIFSFLISCYPTRIWQAMQIPLLGSSFLLPSFLPSLFVCLFVETRSCYVALTNLELMRIRLLLNS